MSVWVLLTPAAVNLMKNHFLERFGIILTLKVGCYDQVKSYQVLTTGRLILGDHGAK